MTNSTIISYIRFHKDVAFLHIKFRNETDWHPAALVDEAIFSLFYLLQNDGVTLVELLWSDSRNSLKMFSRGRATALKTLNIKCKTYPKEKTRNMSTIFGRETPYRGYNFHPIFGINKLVKIISVGKV